MSRSARIVIPGLAHHIIARGNNRRTLFSYPTDYRKFINHVGKALEKSHCCLHAMTLMMNHVHLIATPAAKNDLAIFVQTFAQRYAQHRNRRRNSTGKLFQERYISKPIKDERYHAIAQIYVEINAWRAGKVDDPLDYPWSTFRIHAGHPDRTRIPLEFWTPSRWYLGLGESSRTRAERYLELASQFYHAGIRPPCAERIDAVEEVSLNPCRQRLERPDRSRAS